MADVIDINAQKSLKRGEMQWHCSEEDSGPDVGILLKLDDKRQLWAGEISRSLWEDHTPDSQELGSDGGWWIVLYSETGPELIGKAVDQYSAQTMIEAIAGALTGGRHAS